MSGCAGAVCAARDGMVSQHLTFGLGHLVLLGWDRSARLPVHVCTARVCVACAMPVVCACRWCVSRWWLPCWVAAVPCLAA